MTRQQLALSALTATAVVVVVLVAPAAALALGAVAAFGALVYWLGRCHHRGPLGLLPPTTADDGTRLPARWYCDAFGRIWPANLEQRDRSPIVRFFGHDQSKLPAAARRAAALEKQRHSLAVRRAGLVVSQRSSEATPANVTSISQRRAAR